MCILSVFECVVIFMYVKLVINKTHIPFCSVSFRMSVVLTHLGLLEFSSLINWMSQFSILELLVLFFIFIQYLFEYFVNGTVETQPDGAFCGV